MKSVIVCLAIIAISLVFTVHTYAEVDFETARGIWLLNEGKGDHIEDISGNENHGELQGGKWVKGPDGPALSLNGQDDRVIIPDSDSMYLEKAWSITSWVHVNKSENGYGHILGKRPAGGVVANYAFRTSSSGTGWEAYFANGGWKGAWNQSQVKKDEWLYMTATYDAKDTIKIYEMLRKSLLLVGWVNRHRRMIPTSTSAVGPPTSQRPLTVSSMRSQFSIPFWKQTI